MNDSTIPMTHVAAWTAWTVTALLLVSAWIAAMMHVDWHPALAHTAVIASVIASTLQIRCWAVNVCRLVKITTEVRLTRPDADLHSLR